jgi:flavin reductase (DIM6/NTAB) family NADH-FMN oxidoreductase RutF
MRAAQTSFRTVQPHDMIEFIHMSSERSSGRLAPVSSDEFRHACGRFATGVTIATVLDSAGAPHGLTVSSFTSVSLEPPLVSICLGHAVTQLDLFRESNFIGINILSDTQQHLSEHFARRGHDRFLSVSWSPGETGVPLIEGALVTIECRVEQRIPVGDHDIYVGLMVAASVSEASPLLHFAGNYRKLES